MSPQIRNPGRLALPLCTDVILGKMFPDYQEIVVKEEMTAYGLSGGRVYRVHLLKGGDIPELPLVVKVGPPDLIEREVRAYQERVRNQWPGIAELYGEPVSLRERDVAGLCYPLMGGGVFKMQSLREYCLDADVEDVRFVLEERLFRIMEQRMLRPARNVFEHPLRASYDRVLPVNVLVEPQPIGETQGGVRPTRGPAPTLIAPDALADSTIRPGTQVRVEGFVVVEVDPHQGEVTLDVAPGKPPYAYRLRLHPVAERDAYMVGQVMPPTEGIVRETRQSRLEEEAVKAMGAAFDPACASVMLLGDADDRSVVLPNPLRVVPDILDQSRHVRINYIHGDLNLENVLVDPQVRDVRLIDFADARRDHILLDFLRLETEVVTKLVPAALVEAGLSAQAMATFCEQLHDATFGPGESRALQLPHPALEKPFAILCAIRRAAGNGLYDRDDYAEYYQGLILYLLGALKFANLDAVPEAPFPKQVAFVGAATVQRLLSPERIVLDVQQEPVALAPVHVPAERSMPDGARRLERAVPTQRPVPSTRRPLLRRRGILFALAVTALAIVAGMALAVAWQSRSGPLDINPLCAIEEQLAIPIAMGEPNRCSSLLEYFQDANPGLFDHLDSIADEYERGQPHRGATYVMGGPGVGKSTVATRLDQFSEDERCKVRMGEFAESGGQGIDFEMRDDLVTLDGGLVFNQLPAFADPGAFTLDGLLTAGGCVREGRVVPLVILDDLNELHDESVWLLLKEVEAFISRKDEENPFVHVLVFGRPEAFAPWLRQPRWSPPRSLQVPRSLEGPLYATTGDLDFTYRDYLDYHRKPAPTQDEIDAFIKLIADHPFLTYSIRALSVRNFVIETSLAHMVAEPDLKAAAYDSLIERDRQIHRRGEAYPMSYAYLLEDIAARYLDQVGGDGFFVVDVQDRIEVYDETGKQAIGEVYVRDVLDRSGIASLERPESVLARYRFDPFWVHAHLVEQRNQRLYPGHAYRTCAQVAGQ
jgi:hypothetical protein